MASASRSGGKAAQHPRERTPGAARIAVVGLRGAPNVIGGVEAHCERLYPPLAKHFTDVEFWLLTRRGFASEQLAWLGDVRIRSLWSPRWRTEAAIHTVFAILYARLALKASVVHLHGIGPAFFSPLVKALGMRLVVTHHATDYARPKWGPVARSFLKQGERMAAVFADRIICVSEALRTDFLARFPKARHCTVTINHGLEPEWEKPAASNLLDRIGVKAGTYALAVGRLDETKRFHDLIAAKQFGVASGLPIIIAGDTVDQSRYARELRLTSCPNVTFLGDVYGADLRELYRNAALLIHPSEMEGFGLVILEALACGVPVLASDIPVHREFDLPDAAYFAVGDLERISQALRSPGSVPRVDPQRLQLQERFGAAGKVRQHAALFADLMTSPMENARRSQAVA